MESQTRKPLVLIIGAGSTGLLIAQGLKKSGIRCIVFEKTDQASYTERPRHWSMALHWGAAFMAKCLPDDILADIRTIEADPSMVLTPEQEKNFPFVNGKTGEVIALIPGQSTRRASRAKMRMLFSRGLDVRYGKRLSGVEDDGQMLTVRFVDGTTIQGDLLVGCDGAKSTVRASLITPAQNQMVPIPLINAHIAVTYTREQALFLRNAYHPSFAMSPHPEQNTSALVVIADINDPDKPETWVFLLNYAIYGSHEQPESNADRLKLLRSYADNYCEPFRSAVMWLPEDTWVPPDVFRTWTPVPWDNHGGRITIAGDAAHPVSPFRGQGLNLAIEDAFRYVEAVEGSVEGGKDLAEAIDAYDAEIRARGSKEIELSNVQTYGTHHWDALMKSPFMNKIGTNKVA